MCALSSGLVLLKPGGNLFALYCASTAAAHFCCPVVLRTTTRMFFATRASDVNVVRLPVSFSVWRMEWVKQFLVSFLVFSCRSTTT